MQTCFSTEMTVLVIVYFSKLKFKDIFLSRSDTSSSTSLKAGIRNEQCYSALKPSTKILATRIWGKKRV